MAPHLHNSDIDKHSRGKRSNRLIDIDQTVCCICDISASSLSFKFGLYFDLNKLPLERSGMLFCSVFRRITVQSVFRFLQPMRF